jgi:tRNA A-37 threonylcarbamoyl transferase component Bud32/tetratricopeptide (TPR) repeat protein
VTPDIRDQLQQTLGSSYLLERELGGGGMSRVFVATETRLRRKVVIKVLSPELSAGVNAERFEREIQLAASLQQANIVPLLSAGDTNGLPYFTMPYVEGESLRARLGQGPLPTPEVVGILRDVARALGYAHEHGVVHRDIKPDNVLLSHGTAVVTDFGIAKALSASRAEAGADSLTQIGTSIGTPAYMAPEQAAGDVDTDHRADLYAFGCMAYELLTGRPPFHDRTPARILAAHLTESAPPVQELRRDIPPMLADVVMRCLAKAPEDRPQTAAELSRALETITTGTAPVATFAPGSTRRALALYAAAFLVVAVVARLATRLIGLPEWVFPGALIVMALGLPVILLTALKASPRLSWRRAARGGTMALGGFALAVAAFMVMRALGIGPAASLLAAGKLHQQEPILLTDFRVSNADTTLGRVASDAVRQGLLESSVISLVPPTAIAATLQLSQKPATARLDLSLAREIALRQGVKAIIDGEVSGVAGGYFVTLRLVSTDSLATIASFTASGNGPEGFMEAMDKVSRALRARAGESLRKVQSTARLAEATTGSLDALRKYSEAFRANAVEQNPAKSVALARDAVRLDSTFAMAWRLLGTAMVNAGMPQAASDSALERAYNLRGRLTDRERLTVEATYFTRSSHRDRAAAIAAWEALLAIGNATDSGAATNYLAIQYASRRQFARAESLYVMGMRADSTSAFIYTNRVPNLVNAGRLPEARAAAELAEQRIQNAARSQQLGRTLLYYEGRFDEFRHQLDSIDASGDPSTRTWAANWKWVLDLREGRLAEMDRLGAQVFGPDSALSPARRLGSTSDVALWVDGTARKSKARATQRIETALARTPIAGIPRIDRPYLSVVQGLAVAGLAGPARVLLAEYSREVTDTVQRRLGESAYRSASGEVLLAEGRYPEAIAEFRAADTGRDGWPANACLDCLPWDLARTFDAAGQPDSAIVMFERVLGPEWGVIMDAARVPYAHERLGALYESRGDRAKAAAHYREFVALWKNADAELQPRVTAARTALRRLSEVEKPPS